MSIKINPDNTALLLMDLQEMMRSRPTVPYTPEQVFAQAARLLEKFHARGMLVIFVKIGFSADQKDRLQPICDQPYPASAYPKPDVLGIVKEMSVQPSDLQVTKRQWGAFYGTELELQLRRRGITTLVHSGISTAMVVESTARQAFELGFHQIFAEDAMSAMAVEEHVNASTRIFPRIGLVRKTAEILKSLGGSIQ